MQKPIVVRNPIRQPTAAELALKMLLAQSKFQGHARCVAHAVGVFPA